MSTDPAQNKILGQNENPAPKMLNTSNAARVLSVSASTLRNLEKQGLIKSVRQSNGYRAFILDEVIELKKQLSEESKKKTQEANSKLLNAHVVNEPKVEETKVIEVEPLAIQKVITPTLEHEIEVQENPKSFVTQVPEVKYVPQPTQEFKTVDIKKQKRKVGISKTATVGALAVLVISFSSLFVPSGVNSYRAYQFSKKVLNKNGTISANIGQVLALRASNVQHNLVFHLTSRFLQATTFESPVSILADLEVTGVSNLNGGTTTPTLTFTGTGTMNGLLGIDDTTETTLEEALDLNGDVVSVGLNDTQIASNVIDDEELVDDLTFTGTFNIDGEFQLQGEVVEATADEINVLAGLETSNGGIYFAGGNGFTQDATNLLWDDTNNRLGLGTSSPAYTLHVVGTTYTTGFTFPTGASAGYILTSDASGNASWEANSGGASWTLSGTDLYPSSTTYDVGIGNTSPNYKLDVTGDIGIASGSDLYIGSIGLNDTAGTTTSGASLIGTFDEFSNSNGTNVQDVLDDLDAAIGAGSSKWAQDTGFIYLNNTTDEVVIGGTGSLAAKLAIDGDSNEVQFRIQGSASQTANLIALEHSDGTDLINVDANGNFLTGYDQLDGTATTTNGSGSNSTALIVDDVTNYTAGNYVQVVRQAGNCSGTRSTCYAKINNVNGGTNTLTLNSPLVWGDGDAVTEWHVPELGGANTTVANNPNTNRWGILYSLTGMTTGNGSTNYFDGQIYTSDVTSFNSTSLSITTGSTTTSGNSGDITIDTGSAADTEGSLFFGTTNAAEITIGRTGIVTNIAGNLEVNSQEFADLTGNGLTLSSNALTILPVPATNGLSTTVSNGSGLEVFSTGIGLLQGCADGEVLKWNETNDSWECATDSGAAFAIVNIENNDVAVGTNVDTIDFSTDFSVTASPSNEANIAIADDILDFTELQDTLDLDASTEVNFSTFNLTLDLDSSGDFIINDAGTPFAQFLDDASIRFGQTDYLNVANSGDLTFVDADGSATITGPAGGNLIIAAGNGTVALGAGDDLAITAATDLVFGGTTSLGETTGATDSGAYLVGVFDEFANSNGANVQDVLDDLDAAIGAGASKWTQGTGLVYLTTTTDEVIIGGTASLSSKLAIDGDNDEIQLLVQGNGTQTTNLVVFENSAGTDQFALTNTGNLTIAGDATISGGNINGPAATTLQVAAPGGHLLLSGDSGAAGSQIQFTNEAGDTAYGYFITGATNTGDFSVDTETLYVDASSSNVGIGTTTPSSSFMLDVMYNQRIYNLVEGAGNNYLLTAEGTIDPANSATVPRLNGNYNYLTHDGTGTATVIEGEFSELLLNTGSTTGSAWLNRGAIYADGTQTTITGYESNLDHSGSTTEYYGFISTSSSLAGTIGTSYGMALFAPSGSGTITNNYGLYVGDHSGEGSSASYNIYSAGATALNYFAGNVGVGTTGPDAKADILSTSGEQLRLTYADGSSFTGFTVDTNGDLTINASGGDVTLASGDNLNLTAAGDLIFGGTTSLAETTSATDSGAFLVGVFDEFTNSNSSNVQDVLDDLDAAIGAGASKWTQGTGLIYLTTTTDEVVIGGTASLSSKLAIDGDADEVQLLVQGNGTQTANLVVFETSAGTDLFTITNAGNLTIAGDFTVTGNDIAFGNGETISNAVDGTISLNPTTFTLTGTTTFNGTSLTAINGGATAIDFTEFDVSASTGAITIDDGGNAGNISIEGTVLDINSLDFVGAGLFTSGSNTNLSFTPGGTGDVVINNDSDTILSLTGGTDGTAALTIAAGNLTLTDGDLALSGGDFDVILDAGDASSITNSSATGTAGALVISQTTGATNVGDVDGASVSLTLTNYADDGIADIRTGFDIDVSNNATDASTDDTIYGLRVQNLGGSNNADGTEYAIYQAGTGWDYGLYVEDATLLNSTLAVNGNTTIGDANSDTLTINSGTSGTGIAFGDSSFANCTALETVGGVLTCGSDAGAGGGGGDMWTDAGSYLYPTSGEGLGNSSSGGSNKIANLYLTDDAGITFGTTNDFTLLYDETTDDRLELGDGTNTFLSIADAGTSANFIMNNSLQLGLNGVDGALVLYNELGGTDYTVTFALSGSQTESYTLTLPPDDGSNNYVLTTNGAGTLTWQSISGVGSLTGSGTAGQVAFFDGTNSIASETSGFGWDATNNLFTIEGLSTATTATTQTLTSSANTLTSGGLFSSALTSSGITANFTGDVGAFSSSRTLTAAATQTDTGNLLDLSRTSVANNAGGTFNVTGALLNISNTATQTAGTLTDSANLIAVTQDADATGALLYLNANRTGNNNAVLIEQSAGGTDILSLQDDGDLAILGDLTVTGNDIAFGNGETISNAVDGTISLNPTTFTLTGTTTLNGTSLTSINGGATAIDFTEFDVSATTGAITINDGGDAGNISIEGTVLDMNSLDFVGAGLFTSGSNTNLSFTPGGSGDVVINNDSDTILSLTGGTDGTAALTIAAGNLTLTDGDLTLSSGDFNVTSDDGDTINIAGDGSPTSDLIGVSAGTSATDGVDALQLTFGVSAASGNIIDITPSYADATAGSTSETYNIIDIDAFTATQNASGDTGLIRALNIGNLTQTEDAGTITANALNIGTGWDDILNYNGTTVIDGDGTIASTIITGTLFTVAGDTGSGTIVQGDTLTLTGGTGIATAHSGDTNTLSFDCSEVEGTDIDCSGESITLESTIDSVSVINLSGTGTLNGLDAVDSTTEDTIEALIFDSDAENISGIWEVQDDIAFRFGNDADFSLMYDETTDDRLELTSSANTGLYLNAATTTGNLFALGATTLTTGNVMDLTATYVDATGGTDSAIDINLTNNPASSANTLRGLDISISDADDLANTLYGSYIAVDNSSNSSTGTHSIYGGYFSATGKTAGTTTAIGLYASASGSDNNYAAIFESGNVGIGDTTPGSLLEVGNGTDSIQINSTGDITFVDANDGASITGPAGGALSIVAGASQALTLTGNTASSWTTSSGALTITSAAAATWGTAAGDLTLNVGDEVVFGDTDTLIIGGHAGNVAYNVISDSGGSPDLSTIDSDDDLYIGGGLEVDGAVRFDGATDFVLASGENVHIQNSTTSDNTGLLYLEATTNTGASGNNPALGISWINSDDVTVETQTALLLNLTNASASANDAVYGIQVIAAAGSDAIDAGLNVRSATSGGFEDGILIDGSTGAMTNAINIDSPDVIITDINLQNGESIDNDTDNQINLNIGSSGTLLLTSSTSATIANDAGDIILNSADEVVLGDTDTLIIGGHAGGVAYNAISDSGGSPGSASVNSDDDLYIEGFLEIDGGLQVDATVTANDFACTDCLDFAEFEDTLDVDANTEINLSTFNLSFDLDNTGVLSILDAGTAYWTFDDDSTVDVVFPAAGTLGIDAATTDSTTTGGVFDLNVDTITTGNIGFNLDHIIRDSAGITAYGARINQTIDTDAGHSSTGYGLYITGANDDASSTLTGLYVDAGTGAGTEYAAAFVNGFVGIGDTTPDAALDIAYDANGNKLILDAVSDNNGSQISFQQNGTEVARIGTLNGNSDDDLAYAPDDSQYFYVSDTELVLQLINGGNGANSVRVGTVDPTTIANFSVVGMTGAADLPLVRFEHEASVTTDYLQIATNGSSTGDILAVDSTGDLGLGDATPDARLDLVGTANSTNFISENNTATTLGVSAAGGLNVLSSTSLTTGDLLELQLTESALNGGSYLRAWDVTGSASVFSIGEDGNTVIAGSGDGTDVLTLTTGDILLSDGDLDLSGGDFNVTLDAGDAASITNGGATGTAGALVISQTTGATNVDAVDGASVSLTLTDYVDDGAADVRVGFDIDVTNNATDASTDDTIYGLRVQNLGGSNNADGTEYGLYVAGTGWDYSAYFEDTAFVQTGTSQLGFEAGETSATKVGLYWDGNNDLARLTSYGGTLNITTDSGAAITTNRGWINTLPATSSHQLDAAATDSTGTAGVLDINLDATSSQQGINIDAEVIDDDAIDTMAGVSVTMTNSANDSDVVYGLHVANLGGAASGGNEYAIYQAGTGWDYGLYIEDAALLNSTLAVNGNTTIGDANSDTLTINAGSSGTGIAFGDSSFANCTALETVGGVLTCGTDEGGSSTPGGNDTEIQYNNGGSFGGTSSLTYNDSTFALSVTDDIDFVFGAAERFNIDGGTTDRTADAVTLDIDVNSASVDGIFLDLDVGTELSAAEIANAISLDIAGLAGDDATSQINGLSITGDTTTAGTVTGLLLAGSFDVGIDLAGSRLDLDADNDTSIIASTDDQIDIEIAGANDFQFTANTFSVLSGSTLAGNSGSTIDINGDLTIADTDIAFDGASTTLTTTGILTINTGGAITIGDGGDTIAIDSSDWDITTDGTGTGFNSWTVDNLVLDANTLSSSTGNITLDPASTGDVFFHGATYNWSDEGDLTLGGRVTFENSEYIINETNDEITFGVGGADEVTLNATALYAASAEGSSLGTTANEWEALYLGDNNGVFFGLDQDWSFGYDELTDDRLELVTTGTSGMLISSATLTGTGLLGTFDSVTTGRGFDLSIDGLTTGDGFRLQSTTTSSSFSGNLGYLEWAPGSATIATGDLFQINMGTNGTTTGNLFTITDTGSNLFSVSETKITSALPHEFTAAGDVSIAYDIVFTNQTSSLIESYGPLTITSGESFENNNLTLKTYGTGDIVFDIPATGYATFQGAVSFDTPASFTAADTTPDVSGGSYFLTTGTATITDFDAGSGALNAGHIIVVQCDTAVTFDVTGSGLNGGTTDIVCADGDMTQWIYDGTDWNLLGWMDDSTDGGQDLAEYFTSDENLEAGDVVSIDPNKTEQIVRTTSAYQTTAIGIVSTKPGLILGAQDIPNKFLVGLAGRVPTKISFSSEPIQPGDYLTASSEPGEAMKATSTGRVIGQALEEWSPLSGNDKIMVFINPSWYTPTAVAMQLDGLGNLINQYENINTVIGTNVEQAAQDITAGLSASLDQRIAEVNTTSDTFETRISSLEEQVSLLAELLGDSEESTESTESTESLDVTEILAEMIGISTDLKDFVAALGLSKETDDEGNDILSIGSDLVVSGNTTLNNVQITGDLAVGLIEVNSLDNAINIVGPTCYGELTGINNALCESQALYLQKGLSGNIDAFDGAIVLQPDGTLTAQTLVANVVKTDELVLNATSTLVGEGIIWAGQTESIIYNTSVATSSKIFVTAKTSTGGQALYVAEKLDNQYFKIKLDTAFTQDITFDWWILNTEN